MDTNYEVIFCIVNAGFSELVMDAAKEVGARGGTVINARGTANKEAEQFFQILIQPDKEIVMILVPTTIKDAVLHAVYQKAGLKTEGHGIAFSMAVESAVGLSGNAPLKPPAKHEHSGEKKGEGEQPKPQAPATNDAPAVGAEQPKPTHEENK